MGRQRVWLALAVVVLGAAAVAGVLLGRAVPSGPPVDGNALQPLADDLTWVYRPASQDISDPRLPLVIGVVGREEINGERAWLLQQGIGQPGAARLIVVTRQSEVWAVGADAFVDDRWQRTIFRSPQLYQPAAGPLQWKADFSDGPEAFRFTASWEQRPSGQMTVLGRTGAAWLLLGDLAFGDTKIRENDTLVEGVGLANILSVGEGYSIRWNLVAFGSEPSELENELVGTLGNDELHLTLDPPTLVVADEAPQALDSWVVDGAARTFDVATTDGNVHWAGRVAPAGLRGTATQPDGSQVPLDFVELLPDQP